MVSQRHLKSAIKAVIPQKIRSTVRKLKLIKIEYENGKLPLRDVFTRIYTDGMWNEGRTDGFNSGPGSNEVFGLPYAEHILAFMDKHGLRSLVDIGCGDFRVGKFLAKPHISYTGLDVVEPLIADNTKRHSAENIRFLCLDATKDALPGADVCLIRQVLQHLSNAEIAAILDRVKQYPYVIVTEDQPGLPGTFKANKNKYHGQESRIVFGSGIVLSEPPFNLENVTLLFKAPNPLTQFGVNASISSFLLTNQVG